MHVTNLAAKAACVLSVGSAEIPKDTNSPTETYQSLHLHLSRNVLIFPGNFLKMALPVILERKAHKQKAFLSYS